MRPSSRSQSAATTALRKVHGELFRVKRLREIPHCSLVDFGALSTPYRCKFNRQNTWRPVLYFVHCGYTWKNPGYTR